MEGINKNIDPEFEKQKERAEWENKQESHKYLASKFSEVLNQNPIVVYTQHRDSNPEDSGRKFDKVEEVRTDESGTGGSVSVIFDYNNWVAVDKKECKASSFFDKNNDYYKITEESFHNILDMMDELIKISGYTEIEKGKMFQSVVDSLKNKIVKKEDL